jgi:crotonobetainyl-CoA:carnitine CoA-transferase CaiB-like acyl-CoA transferase
MSFPQSAGSGPLADVRVVLLALNLPGPIAASRLVALGASVVKVEPLTGDPFAALCPAWYDQLSTGIDVRRLDLKASAARGELEALLADADLLITSFRPSSLQRLGLDPAATAARHPRLGYVAIVGEAGARAEIAGHDLTYQASLGLVIPPGVPRTLLADLAGAERAVSAALALLAGRGRGVEAPYAEVSLAGALDDMLAPWRFGLTHPSGPLGGESPFYRLYETADGWIAVAALEGQFAQRLTVALGIETVSVDAFAARFATRPAAEWEAWAMERDLPIAVVRALPA